jgi:hypothetical protein
MTADWKWKSRGRSAPTFEKDEPRVAQAPPEAGYVVGFGFRPGAAGG